MKKVFLMIFVAIVALNISAQNKEQDIVVITTKDRIYYEYSAETKEFTLLSSNEEYGIFEISADSKMYTHSTPIMTSVYSIDNLIEVENGVWESNVTSDVGNKYYFSLGFNIISMNLIFTDKKDKTIYVVFNIKTTYVK